MKQHFYVTTPIYYVNARPHLGHVYTTVIADVLARFHKLLGEEVFFLTGTDEHGDKIMETARDLNTTPKELADDNSQRFRDLWPLIQVENDRFIRTTDQDHVKTVQRILQEVYDRGDIYFGEYGGHYCTGCERFMTETEMVDGNCPIHQKPLTFVQEQNYFFRMEKYRPWLIEYIQGHPDFIRPERYKNEVLGMLRGPIDDLCISRPKKRLSWGIELPFDPNYVCYVWFDALINYLTGIGYPDDPRFRDYWAQAQHLVGKDILKPHAVYWPTMLKAMGLEPYRNLNVHGFWNVDATKMSKSLGNVVDPLDMKNKYGVDAFRYFLVRDMVFGLDSNFSEEALVERYNADLANDLGNLVSRSAKMVAKYFGGVLPSPDGPADDMDRELRDLALRVVQDYTAKMNSLELHTALMAVWSLVSALNKYIDRTAPWELAKKDMQRLAVVMYTLMEAIRFVALLVFPVMPGISRKILDIVGAGADLSLTDLGTFGLLRPGTSIGQAQALFPRVEKIVATGPLPGEPEEKKPARGKKEEKAPNVIDIGEFGRIEIKVGRILSAGAVEKSDKLVILSVDVGRTIQIVAGIGKAYAPEELVGKHIAVVTNLKPATLMGLPSEGMLLATDTADGKLTLVGFDRPPRVGARIR
ncbi:MAG TPA: methionine--tRNA ligase [Deltaproteobacteria bacterium]|nr:methionine--tRNA ligase [Deltaproteobacteria bacterium]HQI80335.1 methionine--tRNA ligase [Deltaproteobacteria bacterium]